MIFKLFWLVLQPILCLCVSNWVEELGLFFKILVCVPVLERKRSSLSPSPLTDARGK